MIDMASSKGASPSDNKSAAQAAVETAQAVASGTLRIPRASLQIAAQLPDLVENLAVATERLNTTIDRAERYMALADPMVRAMDRLLPQLEALIATGNDVFKALSNLQESPGWADSSANGPLARVTIPRTQGAERRTSS